MKNTLGITYLLYQQGEILGGEKLKNMLSVFNRNSYLQFWTREGSVSVCQFTLHNSVKLEKNFDRFQQFVII